MIALDYQNLIRELCEAVGIADWQQVDSAQQIDIDGVVAWLLHDEMHAPDVLSVFFHLGVMHDLAVLRYLLAHNAASPTRPDACGRFGLLMADGSVVYRLDLPWQANLTGAELAQRLSAQLESARSASCVNAAVSSRDPAHPTAPAARAAARPGTAGCSRACGTARLDPRGQCIRVSWRTAIGPPHGSSGPVEKQGKRQH